MPPYVQTRLHGERQATGPRAMPLDAHIAEATQNLSTQPDVDEVGRRQPLRFAAENGTLAIMFQGVNGVSH